MPTTTTKTHEIVFVTPEPFNFAHLVGDLLSDDPIQNIPHYDAYKLDEVGRIVKVGSGMTAAEALTAVDN